MRAPLRVAVVGGDEREGPSYPEGVEVRRYGSRRFRGNGGLRRILAAIRTGELDAVVVLVRWLGHPASKAVRAACRRAGVRCRVVTGGESAVLRVVRALVEV
jgi:hypothetical protein